jgi:hypothetical protein
MQRLYQKQNAVSDHWLRNELEHVKADWMAPRIRDHHRTIGNNTLDYSVLLFASRTPDQMF